MRNVRVSDRTRLQMMVAATVSMCLVAMSVSACGSTDDSSVSAGVTHSPVGADGFRLDHDDVSVLADAGVAAVGTDVSIASVDAASIPAPDGMFQAFGSGVEVQLANGTVQPRTPVHLRFRLDPAIVRQHLDAGDTLAIFTHSDTDGDLLPAHWDAQNNVLSADATHLTPFVPGWLDPSSLLRKLGDGITSWLGLRFPKPDCVDKDASLDSVTIKSSPVDRDVAWPCVAVSDRRFHVELHSNSAWTWLVTTKPDIRSFEVHGRDLAGALAAGMFYGSKIDKVHSASVLVSGDTTTFPFASANPPRSGDLKVDAGLSLVSAALNEISAAASLFHIKLGMEGLVKDVGKLSCLAGTVEGLNNLSANDFGAKAGALGKAVLDCAGSLGGFAGAVFLGAVAAIISALFVSLAGIWNTLTGQDTAYFTITTTSKKPVANDHSFGPLQLGMATDQATAALSGPISRRNPYPPCTALSGRVNGVPVSVYIKNGVVTGIDAGTQSNGSHDLSTIVLTDRGVGTGSTPTQIRDAYISDHTVQEGKIGGQGSPAVIVSAKSQSDRTRFISFPILDGKSGPPSIGRSYASEGC